MLLRRDFIGHEEQGGYKGDTGQATVPDDSRADVSVHGFWKWGTTALFDMRIVNLYVGSYLRHTSANALTTAEKEIKDKYLQPFSLFYLGFYLT